jgi:uncharacterized membrane protein YqhA
MARFEAALLAVRYVMLAAVVVLALISVAVVAATTVDAVGAVLHTAGSGGREIRSLGGALQLVEGYLLAAILFIFAVGLYELFIVKIDLRGIRLPKALDITSVDDLKARLGRVVLLGLVIEFFQRSLAVTYTAPVDVLYMAGGILLVGAALYLSTERGQD